MLVTPWSVFGSLGMSKQADMTVTADKIAIDERILDMWVILNTIMYKCNYILKHE